MVRPVNGQEASKGAFFHNPTNTGFYPFFEISADAAAGSPENGLSPACCLDFTGGLVRDSSNYYH